MKDPAVLFYYASFMNGTRRMSFAQKGIYIDLLCEQCDSANGSISEEVFIAMLDTYETTYGNTYGVVKNKFTKDDKGYYNEIMRGHLEKRRKYAENRRENLLGKTHMGTHMGTHTKNTNKNINENVISNKGLMEEPSLAEVVHHFTESGHSKEMAESFYSYYSSQDWKTTSGISIKKRWQNKVIGWLNNQKEFSKSGINKKRGADGAFLQQLVRDHAKGQGRS